MKKWSIVFMICILSTLYYNCSNDGDVKIKPIYNSTKDIVNALDSLHINLSSMTKHTTYFISGWAGDDITTTFEGSKRDFIDFDKRDQSFHNNRPQFVWNRSYKLIIDINNIIHNADELRNGEDSKDYLVGEAFFIRALLYQNLIRLFEKTPLQTGLNIDINIAISETSEVYHQIEQDFLTAVDLLPDIHPNSEPGASRPNKGSALAFLSRLYLDWAGFPVKDNSKYTLAASTAKQVIDNHQVHGFELMLDLDDLWTIKHRFNKESIFTIVHCVSCPQGGNSKTGKIGIPGEYGGWRETYGEIKFFETFPENHRKQATYITDLHLEDPFSNPPGGETINWVNFQRQKIPLFAKITGKGDISRTTYENDRNDYMMRYAEVLLTFAEASARSGDSSPEAWEALNKIRRRAELLPSNEANPSVDLNTGDLAELAYTERGWELAGEYLRWNDLVRMERVSQFLNESYRNDISSKVTDPNNIDYGKPIRELNTIVGSLETDNYFVPLKNDNYKNWY